MSDTSLVGGLSEFSSIEFSEQKNIVLNEENAISNNLGILELFNLMKLNNKDLTKLLKEKYNLDIKTDEGIEKFQELYNKAFKLYTEMLLIELKKPFKGMIFNSSESIINFLKNNYTSVNTERRQIYCDLTKIMFGFHQVEQYPHIKSAKNDIKEFVADNIFNNEHIVFNDLSKFMSEKDGEDYYEGSGKFSINTNEGNKKLNFILRFRGKSVEKAVLKLLYNENGEIDIKKSTLDNLGIEFEAENKEDSIYFLELLYFIYKKVGVDFEKIVFRQKPGFYNKEDFDGFKSNSNLTKEFRDFLYKTGIKTLKKTAGNTKYQDAKYVGGVKLRNNEESSCEGRVVTKGNKNQSGLSNSKIIDGKKKALAVIGLRGWVSENYIKRIIGDIKGKESIKTNEEKIFEDIKSCLICISIPGINKKLYSTLNRSERIGKYASNAPQFIINGIRKYIGDKAGEIITSA